MPTKQEKHAELVAKIEAELPDIDIGQWRNVTPPKYKHIEKKLVMRLARRIMQGASMRDACILAGVQYRTVKRWGQWCREFEEGTRERVDPWIVACHYTVERARSILRLRWQLLAEAGGKGSSTALWMLERRGGQEYRAPAQRHEVNRKTTEVHVVASIDDALNQTAQQLGLDAEQLKQQGDYWAKAITASQRGNALPAPPIDTTVIDEE